jgi:hypothetical protein
MPPPGTKLIPSNSFWNLLRRRRSLELLTESVGLSRVNSSSKFETSISPPTLGMY